MTWLPLTQANTGVTIYVNMDQVIIIAPNKTGGSALLTTIVEKETGRIIPVREAPQEIATALQKAGAPIAGR